MHRTAPGLPDFGSRPFAGAPEARCQPVLENGLGPTGCCSTSAWQPRMDGVAIRRGSAPERLITLCVDPTEFIVTKPMHVTRFPIEPCRLA